MASGYLHYRHQMLDGFRVAGRKGFTDDEAAQAAGVSLISCYWKRAGELRDLGLVQRVEDKKGNPVSRQGGAGVTKGVWQITPEGRATLKAWNKLSA